MPGLASFGKRRDRLLYGCCGMESDATFGSDEYLPSHTVIGNEEALRLTSATAGQQRVKSAACPATPVRPSGGGGLSGVDLRSSLG